MMPRSQQISTMTAPTGRRRPRLRFPLRSADGQGDDGEVGGAEGFGEEGEAWGGGALLDRSGEAPA